MPRARQQCERHRMRDIGADDARGRQQRIEQQQHRHADGAGPHRSQRHQHPQHRAGQYGERERAALPRGAPAARAERRELRTEHQRHGSDQQRGAEHDLDQPARARRVHPVPMQQDQGEGGGRYAAGRETQCDLPVDGAFQAVYQRARRLGGGRVQQVGADRGSRMHVEQQNQDRRHQRAAADTRQADQEADEQAGDGRAGAAHLREFAVSVAAAIAVGGFRWSFLQQRAHAEIQQEQAGDQMQGAVVGQHELRNADEAERRDQAVNRVAGGNAEADREPRARAARQRAANAQHAHRADRRGNREADTGGGDEETGGGHGEP
ncbi:hypothetical protein KCU90_g5616, partial [Aureobasidium melanogenum]